MNKEQIYNTKWDQSKWTDEMKTKWQEKCIELGFDWFTCKDTVNFLGKPCFYLEDDRCITYSGLAFFKDQSFEPKTWEDMFPEDTITCDYIRELKPFEVEVGMKVVVKGDGRPNTGEVLEVTDLYKGDDCGLDLSDGSIVCHSSFLDGHIKVYLVEDSPIKDTPKTNEEDSTKNTTKEWTDSHYDVNYTLTEEDIKRGFVRMDVYQVNKIWKLNSADDTGAAFHTLKCLGRLAKNKNTKEREIRAMYGQIKRWAELEGITLDK